MCFDHRSKDLLAHTHKMSFYITMFLFIVLAAFFLLLTFYLITNTPLSYFLPPSFPIPSLPPSPPFSPFLPAFLYIYATIYASAWLFFCFFHPLGLVQLTTLCIVDLQVSGLWLIKSTGTDPSLNFFVSLYYYINGFSFLFWFLAPGTSVVV